MEVKKYQVCVNDVVREYEEGTTFEAIAKDFQEQYEHQIVLGCENFRLFELKKTLKKDCNLTFVTLGDSVGNKTYKRSMCLMMVKAIHDICGHDATCKVRIDFSVSKGYYCTVAGNVEVNEAFLEQVTERMQEMVDAKMPIRKRRLFSVAA